MFDGDLTVIIPVFNAKHYILKAIDSAHRLSPVTEIIVIDDGSNDGTLQLLNDNLANYSKLRVITHEGGVNMGIAKSRNLGIEHAKADWIAFLDSDDYFLENRFDFFLKYYDEKSSINVIFEPVINKVIDQDGLKRFKNNNIHDSIIDIQRDIDGKTLFEKIYFSGAGTVHLNGMLIKRSLAISVGSFDEDLKIGEDSVFRLKVAYRGNVVQGSSSPVAVRNIHLFNNEPNICDYDLYKKYEVLKQYFLEWRVSKKLKKNVIRRLLLKYAVYKSERNIVKYPFYIISYLFKKPLVVWQYFI